MINSYGEKSIAVLPFENPSIDPYDEFFSEGISEELMNLLSRIPELRVISRSSSLALKEQDLTVPEIAEWLNVTLKIGATAPEAAGEIHTDFQKGFIRAEVIGYDDFVAHNGEHGAKEAGRLRLEGKEYVVQEADVMHFRFNV